MGNIKIGNTNINPTEVKFEKDGTTKNVDVVKFINKNHSVEYLYSKNELKIYQPNTSKSTLKNPYEFLNIFSSSYRYKEVLLPNSNLTFSDIDLKQYLNTTPIPGISIKTNRFEVENQKYIEQKLVVSPFICNHGDFKDSDTLIPTSKKRSQYIYQPLACAYTNGYPGKITIDPNFDYQKELPSLFPSRGISGSAIRPGETDAISLPFSTVTISYRLTDKANMPNPFDNETEKDVAIINTFILEFTGASELNGASVNIKAKNILSVNINYNTTISNNRIYLPKTTQNIKGTGSYDDLTITISGYSGRPSVRFKPLIIGKEV